MRIGYYQGGSFYDYEQAMRGMVNGLIQQGVLLPINLPASESTDNMSNIWKRLSSIPACPYVSFVSNAFWDAQWNDHQRTINRQQALERLQQNELDLVIAMGTWAGQDLISNIHSTTVMAVNSSDALNAGLLTPDGSSLFDHVFVEYNPHLMVHQARLFHDFIGFTRLGVIMANTPDGALYAGLPALQQVAKERDQDFSVITAIAPDSGLTKKEAEEAYRKALGKLAPEIDALWLGAHRGESPDALPHNLQAAFNNNLPTWTMAGDAAVRRGALLGLGGQDMHRMGQWYSQVLVKLMHGTAPADIPSHPSLPQTIVINQAVADRIGYEPPDTLLSIAEEIYTVIEGEKPSP
jgi:hypothetical protein